MGWWRGSVWCVPLRPPPELPPRASLASAASLRRRVYTRARTPASTRRPRAPAARSRVGALPALPPAATGHLLPRLGCLYLTRSVDSCAAGPGLSISSSDTPPLPQTPVGTLVLLARVSHGHVRARRWTRPLQLRLSAPPALFHSSTLSGPLLSQLAVSPPSIVYPFSRSSTSVPQRDF